MGKEQKEILKQDVSVRFKRIVDIHSQGKASVCAEDLESANSTIGNILAGANLPGAEILAKLNDKYDINVNWLLTGKGAIHNSEEASETEIENQRLKVKNDELLELNSKLSAKIVEYLDTM